MSYTPTSFMSFFALPVVAEGQANCRPETWPKDTITYGEEDGVRYTLVVTRNGCARRAFLSGVVDRQPKPPVVKKEAKLPVDDEHVEKTYGVALPETLEEWNRLPSLTITDLDRLNANGGYAQVTNTPLSAVPNSDMRVMYLYHCRLGYFVAEN